MSDELTPPKPTIGDDAHRLAKVAAGMVIPAGGELLEAMIGPPIAKRMDGWRDLLAERVQELLDREQVTIESLQNDPQFIDVVMYASRAAAYTSSEEKRQALANAIYNAGAGRGPDDDEKLAFIRMVDEFAEWHIRVLAFFDDPTGVTRQKQSGPDGTQVSGALSHVLETLYPQLRNRQSFYAQVGAELRARGLIKKFDFNLMMNPDAWMHSRATDRGKALLAFITRPEPADV